LIPGVSTVRRVPCIGGGAGTNNVHDQKFGVAGEGILAVAPLYFVEYPVGGVGGFGAFKIFGHHQGAAQKPGGIDTGGVGAPGGLAGMIIVPVIVKAEPGTFHYGIVGVEQVVYTKVGFLFIYPSTIGTYAQCGNTVSITGDLRDTETSCIIIAGTIKKVRGAVATLIFMKEQPVSVFNGINKFLIGTGPDRIRR